MYNVHSVQRTMYIAHCTMYTAVYTNSIPGYDSWCIQNLKTVLNNNKTVLNRKRGSVRLLADNNDDVIENPKSPMNLSIDP